MNWNHTTYHCLEDDDGTEIPIEVRWMHYQEPEKHEVGDGVETRIHEVYDFVEVRREDNDDLYEESERPTEPWHELFDKEYENGDIQI